MIPSPQQLAAISTFNSGSSFGIRARAGTGKTSTIKLLAPQGALILAFNKRNAEELASKLPGNQCSTLNSVGHKALGAAYGKLTLDTKKFYQIIDNLKLRLPKAELFALRQDYDLARNAGYLPPGTPGKTFSVPDFDTDLDLLHKVLRESIRLGLSRLIDFTDQIYLPACFSVPVPRYPIVIVDEAQDLSPTQHDLVRRSLAPSGQLVVVGDPAQAIYAWRGAATDSYDQLTAGLPILPLTVSYRCPQSVVRLAQSYVPDFQAHPSAPEGATSCASTLPALQGKTYIARVNRPLVSAAMGLLRQGLLPNYLGRDFTTGLRLVLSRHQTPAALDRWYAAEQNKTKTSSRLAVLADRYETLQVLLASGRADEILNMIKENPQGHATFSTVHKAKGFEWRNVVLNLACRFDDPQAANVAYVGITRAQESLTMLDESNNS